MIDPANAELDARILRHIDASPSGGGTAWSMTGALNCTRVKLSTRLRSLKKRGVVKARGSFWMRTRKLETSA